MSSGFVGDDRVRQLATTAEIGVRATARRGRLSAHTSAGARYVRRVNDGLSVYASNLPPGGTSIGQAARIDDRYQAYAEDAILGTYLEESIGLNDRLFLTAALQVDGASTFGQSYHAVTYPKAGVSWLVSDEPFIPRLPGLDELRLRYAYGASGQQPLAAYSLASYRPTTALVDGSTATVIGASTLGNPNLQPERIREHEIGFDLTGVQSRVQFGLTWFRRRTVDQIVNIALPPGLGSMYTNLGLTTQHGFEAELTARVLASRHVSLDLMAQHSLRRTKVVDLGGARPIMDWTGGYVEGYPLGARFQQPILDYADINGDGIITFDEVEQDAEPRYAGESTPPISQTLTGVIGLFNRRLRVSALVERRSGFTQVNEIKASHCGTQRCWEAVDPAAPLADQAAAAVAGLGTYTYIEDGSFTRLRELSLAWDLPAALLRAFGGRAGSITVAGRNLALWTDFTGPDPESAAVTRFRGGVAEGIPQARVWSVRLDLGL